MKVQYIGKYPAKTDGIGEYQVNEILEVEDELGERLIKQRNWKKPANQTKPITQNKPVEKEGG